MDRILTFLSGGIISVFLYLLLVFALAYAYLGSIFSPKQISPKVETTISMVEVQLETFEQQGKEEEKLEKKEDEGSQTPRKSEFDRNLLQNLDSYKKEPDPKEKPPSIDDKIAARKKGEKSEPKKSIKEMVDALNIKNVEIKSLNLKSNLGESDPYFDKIYEILSSWTPTNDFLSATVVLKITNSGSFTYILKKSSGDQAFDRSITQFLDSLGGGFPPHTKPGTFSVEVNFKKEGVL